LLAYSHVPGGDTDKLAGAITCGRGVVRQESSQARQSVIRACEHPKIVPRIEIVFDRQQKHVRGASTLAELGAIRVLFPTHAPEKRALGGTKRDKIAPATVVRTENKRAGFQFRESALDVEPAQSRAIAPDCDYFVVTELRDCFDRILKTGGKIPAGLPMDKQSGNSRAMA
jgi:hypothetical protein